VINILFRSREIQGLFFDPEIRKIQQVDEIFISSVKAGLDP
jgi:hypothetical protein